MKKVIIFIGRSVRLVSILILIVTVLIQGSIFLGEISGNLLPLLSNGEIWRFIFQCELFFMVLLAVLFAAFLCLFFAVALVLAKNGSMPRDIWRSLFWSFDLFKK